MCGLAGRAEWQKLPRRPGFIPLEPHSQNQAVSQIISEEACQLK
jgi:hypothetical protein